MSSSQQCNDPIQFREENTAPPPSVAVRPWRVLSVDDDADFQASLSHALAGTSILGRPVELVLSNAMSQAARLLARDRDFAVILLDVVMETDDAGLRLAKGVRDMLGLQEPRIVLLTGQPGFAPVNDVMATYDLTDYCLKSDLGRRGLTNVLTAAIRTYDQLKTVSSARKGLQLILEASNRFTSARSIQEIASSALVELARILHVPEDGIVAVQGKDEHAADDKAPMIVGAAGRFEMHIHCPVDALPEATIARAIQEAISQRRNLATPDYQVLYFPRAHAMAEYAVYLATGRQLDPSENELIAVFAANAAKGFGQVALVSRLDRMAYEDELLGIPNRSALIRQIERACLQPHPPSPNSLVLIDLDNFTGFNEAFGNALGDEVLKAVVPQLTAAFPPPCFVARHLADVFAVFGPSDVVDLDRAQHVLEAPLQVKGKSYRFSACCSKAVLAREHMDADRLVREANTALRRAKSKGPGSVEAFVPSMENAAAERYALMSALVEAIESRALFLMFQPQVDLASGRIVGAEALLRWSRDDGYVPPDQFIPLAEASSHIHAIGQLVIEQASKALKRLADEGLEHLTISINVSTRQFEAATLIQDLLASLSDDGNSIARMGIEVTETAAMKNFSVVTQALEDFRIAGGFVSIDDFGTGMASLEYVDQLPTDHIKIDRSFVSRIGEGTRHEAILGIIMALGRSIDAQLVAEGVETESQAQWLREHGCQLAQGWHFGRPMALDDLIRLCLAQDIQH